MTNPVEVGQTVHFLDTGLTVPVDSVEHRVMRKGQTLTITPELLEAGKDRLGRSWLDDSEDEQARRYGRVVWRHGPLPEDFGSTLEPGSPEHDAARVAALQACALLPDEDSQRRASAAVRAAYGSSSEASSRTLATYGSTR